LRQRFLIENSLEMLHEVAFLRLFSSLAVHAGVSLCRFGSEIVGRTSAPAVFAVALLLSFQIDPGEQAFPCMENQ
jgi:hypothetical protein